MIEGWGWGGRANGKGVERVDVGFAPAAAAAVGFAAAASSSPRDYANCQLRLDSEGRPFQTGRVTGRDGKPSRHGCFLSLLSASLLLPETK